MAPIPAPSSGGPLNRRAFLHQGAAVALVAAGVSPALAAATPAAAAAATVAPPVLIGSQLYGWGQYYARSGRNLDASLDEVFSALRDAGYDYAEGSLDVARPENNARFAERLRQRGLRPVSLYTGGRFHEAGKSTEAVAAILKAARAARDAGFTILVSNPDPIGREKTDAELQTQVAALDQLGRGLKEIGLRFGVHNHTPEMKNNAREFHANFRGTKAGIVDFCFDVHWVFRGGVMPLEALRDYGDRVVTWHLRQSREKIWWEDLDSGDVDYPAIAKVVAERRLPAVYTVELALEPGTKITRSVVENHRRSRDYVRRILVGA